MEGSDTTTHDTTHEPLRSGGASAPPLRLKPCNNAAIEDAIPLPMRRLKRCCFPTDVAGEGASSLPKRLKMPFPCRCGG